MAYQNGTAEIEVGKLMYLLGLVPRRWKVRAGDGDTLNLYNGKGELVGYISFAPEEWVSLEEK